ncbi:MAG TPA: LD-carboxypeptidase, partial [Streptosporangiaceae bacterium]
MIILSTRTYGVRMPPRSAPHGQNRETRRSEAQPLWSTPPKARRGEHIAVLSPSFAAAGAFPAVHEQAMRRLTEVTSLIPVEYPTTRKVGATPLARAADINAAFADPVIRGILAVIGGEDQITVIPHLDAELVRRDPKPFLGMSDNTNLHHWLWANGIASFYGGSSQVHLGPGPVSTMSTRCRCGPLSSPVRRLRSQNRASRRMSVSTGATRAP